MNSNNIRKGVKTKMKYQIIGASKLTKETKKGKHFRTLCVLDPNPPSDFEGIKAEILTLWDSQLEVLSVETVNGLLYSNDSKNYYIDIDYTATGWINSARIYNG